MVKQWKKVSFKDVCFIDAPMVNPQEAKYQLLPHIGNENIEKHTGRLLKFNIVRDDHLISGKYYFCETDVLYGKINPQFGKVTFPGFCGLCSADMYPIHCATELEPNFLKYVLLTKNFTNYSVSVSMRSGMPKVNRDELAGYEFDLPSMLEQKAISKALSDIDALIINLEKLIAKKKAIKQGAMQELLTGKRRLPGYDGEIKYVPLSTLCKLFDDGDWIESKDQSAEGVRLIQTGNVGIGVFLNKSDKQRFVSEDTFVRLNCLEIFAGDVLVSRLPEPAGRACIVPPLNTRMITAVDCTIIRFVDYNPVVFVAYSQTKSYQDKVALALAGSTRQRISRKELGAIPIPVFPTIDEQNAIASIISDMDYDIEKHETKLSKYRSIKQGMMSELLTGRIRLIDKEDA